MKRLESLQSGQHKIKSDQDQNERRRQYDEWRKRGKLEMTQAQLVNEVVCRTNSLITMLTYYNNQIHRDPKGIQKTLEKIQVETQNYRDKLDKMCSLCELKTILHIYDESDPRWIIIDCMSCFLPMVVWSSGPCILPKTYYGYLERGRS